MSMNEAGEPTKESGAKRILLVEDDDVVRGTVRQLLLGQGYEVVTAVDGSEALGQLSRSGPHLIVLDLGLPLDPFGGGIADGFGVLQWLRRSPPEKRVPVVVLTARQDPAARRQALELGASVFLTKPFKADELFTTIRTLLGQA